MKNLKLKALASLLAVISGMGALILLPAWTLIYWQAWDFLAVFGGAGLAIIVYLLLEDPKLLERRMSAGPALEKGLGEKIAMSIISIGFAALLVVPALDHRFHWSFVPDYLSIAGDLLVSLGWLAVFFALKENTYALGIIEVAPDQKLISTGPYAVIRHPMYAGSLMYLIGMPIALGSWCGLLVIIFMLPALVWRLFDEEKLLKRDLLGYTEYCRKVRFRIIPFVW